MVMKNMRNAELLKLILIHIQIIEKLIDQTDTIGLYFKCQLQQREGNKDPSGTEETVKQFQSKWYCPSLLIDTDFVLKPRKNKLNLLKLFPKIQNLPHLVEKPLNLFGKLYHRQIERSQHLYFHYKIWNRDPSNRMEGEHSCLET